MLELIAKAVHRMDSIIPASASRRRELWLLRSRPWRVRDSGGQAPWLDDIESIAEGAWSRGERVARSSAGDEVHIPQR